MSRGFPIALLTIVCLVASTALSMAQKRPVDPNAVNLNSSKSNVDREQGTTTGNPKKKAPDKSGQAQRGGQKTFVPNNFRKQGGGPAGLAVSDPGAEGTKPAKKSSK